MPIVKQVLYGANIYAECCHEELLDDYDSILENVSLHHEEFRNREGEDPQHISESNDPVSIAQSNLRSARAFASILGVLHQLSYLTVTANDIFKSLTLISSDTQERIRRLSSRTADLLVLSPKVGSRMKFNNSTERRPDAVVPSLFMKNTNCAGLLNLFRLCKPVPQLWRIEMYLPSGTDSCYKSYSYPGFFFERWVQAELQRQRAQREQRKADKKAIRLEKRKIRDLETLNRLEGTDSAGQQQQSSVPAAMFVDHDDEAINKEEPASSKEEHLHHHSGEEEPGRSSNVTLQQMKPESPHVSKPSMSSAQPTADKHRSVMSKVFGFKKSDRATGAVAAASENADAAAVLPEKLEKKSSALMDIVRQTTLDKLAARRQEEEESVAASTAGSGRPRVKERDRDRDKYKGKDKNDPSSLTGKPRPRVTMAVGDEPSRASPSPLPSASEKGDALPRGKGRGSVVERKVIPKRSSKVRKYNAERFMQSALVDYATEGQSSSMGETAPGIALGPASQTSAVDASRPLQRPSILQESAASEVQNRRQQVMSMKLGSKIVVSSAGITSKNKGRQASVIVRSAVPNSANASDSDTAVNALIGRKLNKLSEGSEGSSRNGSIRSRSNSILNYDRDSTIQRGRTLLLPRYEEDEHSEEDLQRRDFEAATSEEEGDRGSDLGPAHPHPKPPPPPPGWAAKESPGAQESVAPVLRPPPPPPPPVLRPALPADILGGIRSRKGDGEGDNGLRKVPELQAKPLDPMAGLLLSIKSGSKNLKSVPTEALTSKASKPVEQNKAIAAILANRSKIAGSDSDSDDSDSDFTDDMY